MISRNLPLAVLVAALLLSSTLIAFAEDVRHDGRVFKLKTMDALCGLNAANKTSLLRRC